MPIFLDHTNTLTGRRKLFRKMDQMQRALDHSKDASVTKYSRFFLNELRATETKPKEPIKGGLLKIRSLSNLPPIMTMPAEKKLPSAFEAIKGSPTMIRSGAFINN